MKVAAALLALLWLAAPVAARGDAAERRRAASSELATIAERIHALKAAGRSDGQELEHLLSRAQELAAEIERIDRAAAPPPPRREAGPDAQELHERADLLRDEADRLAATLAQVEIRLERDRRRRELESRLDALAEESALFDEAGPGKLARQRPVGSPTAAADSATGPGATKGIPSPSATSTPAGASTPATSAPAAQTSGWIPALRPSSGALDALAPRPGDSERVLRAKRDELARAVSALRQQADALEAQARQQDLER